MEQFLHDISWVPALRNSVLTEIMFGFTALGYLQFFLVALPLAYWLWDKGIATRLAVLIVFTAITNGFLKDLIQDPRPDIALALDGQRTGESFGLPSGHAQIAIVVWFWIAIELRRTWAFAAAAFIAAGICASRIYLGVHDMEDILGGAALGVLTLAGFGFVLAPRLNAWHKLHPGYQLVLILALVPALILIWPRDGGPSSVIAMTGFLFAWWLGVIYDRHRLDFVRHPNWWIALGAGLVAVAVLLIFMPRLTEGLMIAGLPRFGAQWASMFFFGVYVTLIAPLLFHAARAAGRPA